LATLTEWIPGNANGTSCQCFPESPGKGFLGEVRDGD